MPKKICRVCQNTEAEVCFVCAGSEIYSLKSMKKIMKVVSKWELGELNGDEAMSKLNMIVKGKQVEGV